MNTLKEKLASGETAFGFWGMLPASFGAEMAAGAGYDYVSLDQQHGLIGVGDAVPFFQAVRAGGATPVSRVERNDPTVIGRALDFGAQAVIVPLVNNAQEAAEAVAACRYPPRGKRSYGPVRAGEIFGSADPEDLDSGVLCFVMIETGEGLDNVDEIAATPGIDGIYIGPADLALGLGLAPALEVSDDKHAAAIDKIRLACEENGIIPAIHTESGAQSKKHAEAGFRMITVTSDYGLIRDGAPAMLSEARGD
ncbi:HpcH/HpaI aldolase family protein [Rubrobacter indicoceani]|uniref:HpcH/HpaI aldolase family protein n=1 Tax=Rubrobacter indicoceani TaxID=2051957 RepID=UPI000E5B8B80|nr:aldolase/citrate lyase family protein [Rubrobacter indicoceani]